MSKGLASSYQHGYQGEKDLASADDELKRAFLLKVPNQDPAAEYMHVSTEEVAAFYSE